MARITCPLCNKPFRLPENVDDEERDRLRALLAEARTLIRHLDICGGQGFRVHDMLRNMLTRIDAELKENP